MSALAAVLLAGARIAVPAELGSGQTATVVVARVDGETAPPPLEADAGLLQAPAVSGTSWHATFTAPAVAGATDVTLRAGGGETARIRVLPPPAMPPRAGGGALALEAPALFRLGLDGDVRLRLRAPERPQLFVSAGTVGEPVADGDRWSVPWTPPPGKMPRAVAVIALAGGAADAAWIQLAGAAKVELETEPRSQVVVEVGGVTLGPFRTGNDGRLTVAARVPPGIDVAVATVTDPLGNRREERIALGAPPRARVFAACVDDMLWVAADSETAPTPSAKAGAFGAIERAGTAPLWSARYLADERAKIGAPVELAASLGRERSACAATVRGKRPLSIAVATDRAEWIAGTGALSVTVRVTFSGAGPVPEIAPELRVSSGRVDAPVAAEPGVVRAAWHLEDRLETDSARVHASLAGLEAEAAIALRAAAPARLDLEPVGRIPSDDRVRAQVAVTAQDAFGNDVPVELLSLAAERGTIGAPAPGERGLRAEYVPPASLWGGRDRVVLKAGDRETAAELRLRPAGRVAGVAVGWSWNLGSLSAPAVAAEVRLPVWRPGITLGLEAGWLRGATSSRASGIPERVTSRVQAIPVHASVAWSAPSRVAPYAGAGAGAMFAHTETSSPSSGRRAESALRPLVAAFAGAETGLGPGRVALELGWSRSSLAGRVRGEAGGVRAALRWRIGF